MENLDQNANQNTDPNINQNNTQNANANNYNKLVAAIIVAGILIAGAILLKDSKKPIEKEEVPLAGLT